MWERDCFPKKNFGKQSIEKKPFFYKSFLLTKNSFPLTNLFLYYQTLENVENYLYRRFSNKTNRVFTQKTESPRVCVLTQPKIRRNCWVVAGAAENTTLEPPVMNFFFFFGTAEIALFQYLFLSLSILISLSLFFSQFSG